MDDQSLGSTRVSIKTGATATRQPRARQRSPDRPPATAARPTAASAAQTDCAQRMRRHCRRCRCRRYCQCQCERERARSRRRQWATGRWPHWQTHLTTATPIWRQSWRERRGDADERALSDGRARAGRSSAACCEETKHRVKLKIKQDAENPSAPRMLE
jgi:hypothetical protein